MITIKPILKGTYITLLFNLDKSFEIKTRKGNDVTEIDTYISKKWNDIYNTIKQSDLLKSVTPLRNNATLDLVYQEYDGISDLYAVGGKNILHSLNIVEYVKVNDVSEFNPYNLPYLITGYRIYENNVLTETVNLEKDVKKDIVRYSDFGLIFKMFFINWIEDRICSKEFLIDYYKDGTHTEKYVNLLGDLFFKFCNENEDFVKIHISNNLPEEFLPNIEKFPDNVKYLVERGGLQISRMFSLILYTFNKEDKTDYPNKDWNNRVNKIKRIIELILT